MDMGYRESPESCDSQLVWKSFRAFCWSLKNFIRAYLFQIALEIM